MRAAFGSRWYMGPLKTLGLLVALTECLVATAQYNPPQPPSPGRSSPTGGSPGAYRPSARSPQPPRPGQRYQSPRQTNPGRAIPGQRVPFQVQAGQNPYSRTGRPRQSSPNAPRPQYGVSQSTLPGPAFRNPISMRSPVATRYDPVAASRIAIMPAGPSSAAWTRANQLARSGNLSQLTRAVSQNVKADPSLNGLMNAVSVLNRANAGQSTVQTYRNLALGLAQQQVRAGTTQPLPWVATAKFALEDRNSQLFRTTTQHILQRFPENPHGHYFAGVQAIEDGDWQAAERALKRAEQLGLPKESIAVLLRMAIDNQRWIWQYAQIIIAIIVIWLIGLGLLYLVGTWLSRSAVKAAERDDATAQTARELQLRGFYRWVVGLAGIYYFISLPIILIVSIALPLALGYAALMLPYLNLWLVGVIFLGGLAGILTAISGIRTALIKIEDKPFGRLLLESESPQFWELARGVAEQMQTRPIDEIWVTPQTDMAVTEQGSWIARMQDRGKRVLILGAGLLPGFKVDALRSVLAHEYAHFQHRDTAGGDIALRVRAAMYRFADAIAARGKIRFWDVTIWYLRFYHQLFGRLAFGASRLQEVLADRAAVELYGGSAMISGLEHVIRRSVEFDVMLNEAVSRGTREEAKAVHFYSPNKAITPMQRGKIESTVRDIFQQPTTEADSHPSAQDRFAAARKLGINQPVGKANVVPLLGDTAQRLASEMSQILSGMVEGEVNLIRSRDKHLLECLDAAIRDQPNLGLYETRAAVYYRNGDYAQSLQDINRILASAPNDAASLISRSHLHEALEDYTRMAKDLKRLRGMSNSLPKEVQFDVAIRLADVLLRFKKHKSAAQAYDAALQLQPKSLNAIVGRLKSAAGLGELDHPDFKERLLAVAAQWPEEPALPSLLAAAGIEDEVAKRHWSLNTRPPQAKGTGEKFDESSFGLLLPWIAGTTGACMLALSGLFLMMPSSGPSSTVGASENANTSLPDIESLLTAKPPAETLELKASETTNGDSKQLAVTEPVAADDPTAVSEELETYGGDFEANSKVATASTLSADQMRYGAIGSFGMTPSSEGQPQEESEIERLPSEEQEVAAEPEPLTARELVREAKSKLNEIGEALRTRMSYGRELLPAVVIEDGVAAGQLSWRVAILPQLGLQELYEKFNHDEPWNSSHNQELLNQMPPVYRLESSEGHTRIRVCLGEELMVRPGEATITAKVTDSTSYTSLAYFVGRDLEVPWTKPDELPLSQNNPLASLGIGSDGPAILLMASGRAEVFEQGIHPQKLWALATARGGELIDRRTWFATDRMAKQSPPKPKRPVPPAPTSKLETETFVSIPSVRAPRLSGAKMRSRSDATDSLEMQMKHIGFAMHAYHDNYNCFPVSRSQKYLDEQGKPYLSWRVHLLPFLDQTLLYKKFHLDEPWDSEHNRKLQKHMPDVYRSGRNDKDRTRFLTLSGDHQAMPPGRPPTFRKLSDGTSNTILFLQAGRDKAVPWTKPEDLQLDLARPKKSLGRTGNVIYCGMASGKVLKLPKKVPDDILSALATPRGGELVDGGTVSRYASHALGSPIASTDRLGEYETQRIKDIVLAMLDSESHRKMLPIDIVQKRTSNSAEIKPLLSWRVAVLPYLEQSNLYRQFRRDEPWDSPHNLKLLKYMPDVFRDADDPVSQTKTRILTLAGPDALFANSHQTRRGPRLRQIPDGMGTTILVVQGTQEQAVPWTKPADLPFDLKRPEQTFGQISPRYGLIVGMASGAVHTLPAGIGMDKLKALVTPSGGEVIGSLQKLR